MDEEEKRMKRLELDMEGHGKMLELYCYCLIASSIGFLIMISGRNSSLPSIKIVLLWGAMGIIQFGYLILGHKFKFIIISIFYYLILFTVVCVLFIFQSSIYLLSLIVGASLGGYIFYLIKFDETKKKIKKLINKKPK